MIVECSDFKCRICGCRKYRDNNPNYECVDCSSVFRDPDKFSLNRELRVEYQPEYDLENWGELDFKHINDSGVDLRACIKIPVTINPYSWENLSNYKYKQQYKTFISFGIKIQPSHTDMDVKIYPRSGIAFKYDVRLSNSVAVIDNAFTGCLKGSIINMGKEPFTINPGDRIAQMIAEKKLDVDIVTVDQLDETERGEGGFGSTGKN